MSKISKDALRMVQEKKRDGEKAVPACGNKFYKKIANICQFSMHQFSYQMQHVHFLCTKTVQKPIHIPLRLSDHLSPM